MYIFSKIQWTIASPLLPDKVRDQIKDHLINAKGLSKDDLTNKKGLVFQKKTLYYYGQADKSSFSLRASTPGGGGAIFRAKGQVEPFNNGSRMMITLSQQWAFLVFLLFWFCSSGVGLIWNVYLSIVDKSLNLETFLCLVLICVGVLIFLLMRRLYTNAVREFRVKLDTILL